MKYRTYHYDRTIILDFVAHLDTRYSRNPVLWTPLGPENVSIGDFLYVHYRRLSIIEGSEIEGFYCIPLCLLRAID